MSMEPRDPPRDPSLRPAVARESQGGSVTAPLVNPPPPSASTPYGLWFMSLLLACESSKVPVPMRCLTPGVRSTQPWLLLAI